MTPYGRGAFSGRNEKWQLQNMNESYARKKKQQLFKRYYFLLKTVIEKVNVLLKANREPHIPQNFIRSTVTWFYYRI